MTVRLALALALATLPAAAQEGASLAIAPSHDAAVPRAEGERRLPSLVDGAPAGLKDRDGILSWKALGDIQVIRRDNADGRYGARIAYFAEPVVREDVKALAGTAVKVRGYLLPRQGGGGRSRVLVSALPAADADGCAAGGAETYVDAIIAGTLAPAVDRLVTVEGKLVLFQPERWAGFIYRLDEARIIEEGNAR